jgi:hypothetical protein
MTTEQQGLPEDLDEIENLSGLLTKEEVEEENEEYLSYSEIYGNLLTSNEVIVTIPLEQVEALKTGLKNLKSRASQKAKEDGLAQVDETLSFDVSPSTEYEDCCRVQILLKKQGVVKVKKLEIPDNSL